MHNTHGRRFREPVSDIYGYTETHIIFKNLGRKRSRAAEHRAKPAAKSGAYSREYLSRAFIVIRGEHFRKGALQTENGVSHKNLFVIFKNLISQFFENDGDRNKNRRGKIFKIRLQIPQRIIVSDTCARIKNRKEIRHTSISMVKRENREDAVRLVYSHASCNVHYIGADVVLRKHNAFCRARRARCVYKNSERVRIYLVLFVRPVVKRAKRVSAFCKFII